MSDSDPDAEGESRSERLRRRRQQRQPAQESETDEPSKPSETAETSESSDPDEPSVKDERAGTYMYLPESQKKEIAYRYSQLKGEYEYEYDEDLEKNRHFYPLLIKYGLDSLESMDAEDVREALNSI